MSECNLCNGKPFTPDDDFKKLCIEHSTQVISTLLLGLGVWHAATHKDEKCPDQADPQ
jgi:hypothetical protein